MRAVGLGPLAGVLAIIMQDTGAAGTAVHAEGHEAVDRSPGRGLTAVGANGLQKHRFGIFTQSFPTFLALSLYQIESNTRSAAVLRLRRRRGYRAYLCREHAPVELGCGDVYHPCCWWRW